MENCPFCDAPGAFREATDGSCYVCGMMLPSLSGKNEPEVATAVSQPAEQVVQQVEEALDAPTRTAPTMPIEPSAAPTIFHQGSEPPAIELIHPRNLSPEYARRVTAAWQVTRSPFKNPLETINSTVNPTDESGNLNIGTRSVGRGDEAGIADYKLSEVIGEGAMGTVWSARQASLNREVAIKMPKPSASGSTFGRQLFISEVVVTGQLDHPNIVPIYDLARDESGQLFYAMKRVEGRSWDACMHEEGRTRHDNVEILMKVCDAIRFAHDRHVIHRDIKPQNIMVGSYGEVSVMDWGIALRLPEGTHIPGMAKVSPSGTPAYMAPEMATGNANEIGYHTDVYLLGAVLYEIITGEPPHPAPSGTSDSMVQQKACLLIAARNVITPAQETGELVDIAYKAMATDISDRFATVDEFQSAIRDYFAHAESIALTDRGEAHLTNARELKNGVYEDYAKARFAFDEAIRLWPDNSRARHGLSQATHDYAGSALQRGDFALGLSLVDDKNPAHADVKKKLTSAKRRSQRSRMVALLSAAVAVAALVGGGAFSTISYFQERAANVRAQAARIAAEASEKKAQAAKDEETRQRVAAEDAERKAKLAKDEETRQKMKADQAKDAAVAAQKSEATQRVAAEVAKVAAQHSEKKALTSEQNALAAKKEVQKASYRSEIGLASEEIRRNSFTSAQAILANQAHDETQSLLRKWEWGHLMYLAKEPSIIPFEVGGAARVEAVALSADQKWLAAATDDGHLHVWWRPDGNDPNKTAVKLASPASKRSEPISSLAISKDNQMLAEASGNEVHLWQLPKGEQGLVAIGKSLTYPNRILSIALSPNGDSILTSTSDSNAQLRSLANPDKPLISLHGHLSGPVWQASFSPDGRRVATAGDDESVRIWDAATGKEILKFEGHSGPVYAVAFSPDGKHVVSGGRDRQLLVWDLQSSVAAQSRDETIRQNLATAGEPVHSKDFLQLGLHAAAIHCLAFSPDGKTLFSGSDDNSLRVWDVSSGWQHLQPQMSLRGHGGWVRACAVANDGQHVLSGSYDGKAFLWNWKNYAFPRVLRPESDAPVRLTSATASSDGNWIATAAEDGVVTLWDMTKPLNPTSQKLFDGHDWQATTGAYFRDGSRLLTAAGDNSAIVWDASSGNQLFRIGGRDATSGTGWRGVGAASHDGRWIATGSNEDSSLAKLWDSQTGRLVASLAIAKSAQPVVVGQSGQSDLRDATALAFAPDDQTLFVGDQSGRGYLFRTSDGVFLKTFNGHDSKINAASFTPDGHLLTASSDHTVIKWKPEAGENAPQAELTFKHEGRVVAMDVSADGKLFVAATDSHDKDAVLRLWDAQTGAPLRKLTLSELVGTDRAAAQSADNYDRDAEARLPAIRSVALHPNQTEALVTVFDPKEPEYKYRICAWSWANPASSVRRVSRQLPDTAMALYTPRHDGSILTVGGRGARVRLANDVRMNLSFRPQTPAQRPDTLGGGMAAGVQSLSFSPNSHLVASAGADGSIRLRRFDADKKLWMPDGSLGGHKGSVNSIMFHPKRDDVMLSAGDDRTTRLWRKENDGWKDTTLRANNADVGSVRQAVFSTADKNGVVEILAAAVDRKNNARSWINVWNIDGKPLLSIPVDGPVRCLTVSPDGKWLVAGVGNEAWVWDRALPPGAPVRKLPGHSAEITAIAFAPDGERMFTAGRDFHVKLWDTNSWNINDPKQPASRELLTLEQHTDSVVSLAFFINAKFPALLTAGADGQAILWPSVNSR